MLIDAHTHMWERRMLPDQGVINYLEPVKMLKNLDLGEIFEFKKDEEYPFSDYNVEIEKPIHVMDVNHVDYSVVLATDFGLVNEGRMTNDEYMDWLFGRCSVDDRFIPFIGVDANRKDAVEMIERYVKKYNPKGIKVYPASGFYPDDEKYDRYWKTIDDFGLVVTTHAGMALPPLDEKYCHPKFFKKIADRYPDMKIIIAHLGGKFHNELFPLMDACENVYADCSALQGWIPEDRSMIGKRLDSVTSRYPTRIVFGTDFPLYDEMWSMSQFLDIIKEGKWGTEKIKEDLLGNNMARILGV